MLFERRIVQILNEYNIYKGTISHGDFVDFVITRKWPRINYFFSCSKEAFRRKLETAIDDCIEYEFIKHNEDSDNIKVTEKGRDYIKKLGFIEEFLKRRKRTIVNSLLLTLGAIVTYLVNFFLSK